MEALKGAVQTISRFKPRLAISIYHLGSDPYEIPQFLSALCPAYRYRFNWYDKRSGNDAILYACVNMKPAGAPHEDDVTTIAPLDEVVYRCLFSSPDLYETVKTEHEKEIFSQMDKLQQSKTYRLGRALGWPFRVCRDVGRTVLGR